MIVSLAKRHIFSIAICLVFCTSSYIVGREYGYYSTKSDCETLAAPDISMVRDIVNYRRTGAGEGDAIPAASDFNANKYDFLLPGLLVNYNDRKSQILAANRRNCLRQGFGKRVAERSNTAIELFFTDAEREIQSLDYPVLSPQEILSAVLSL